MEDSGEREQYSKTGIFGRIYRYSTTCEQKAFKLNHHHTTTSDNSRLPENMLGGYNRRGFQFFEQLRFKTLQLFVPNSKRLRGYTQ